jgi:hypothetical protein
VHGLDKPGSSATVSLFRNVKPRLRTDKVRLRHTFLRKLAETKGVHYAHEASGYQSDRYIWRYAKPDQQTLADAVDELE